MVSFLLALDCPVSTHRGTVAALLFVIAAASAFAYIPPARRKRNPLFQLALFREPNFSVGQLGNLLCRIGSSAVPFLLPLLMQL